MTLSELRDSLPVKPFLMPYGKADDVYLIFADDVPQSARWDLFHLSDYVVLGSASGPGYVIVRRDSDAENLALANANLRGVTS